MNDLRRELAPITDAGWAAIDDEARRTLFRRLAGRRLVDFHGPLGWEASALSSGKARRTPPLHPAVEARVRQPQPFVELQATFEIERAELDAIDRGSPAADLSSVREAALSAALAEDRAIFHGYPEACITGLIPAAEEATLRIPAEIETCPGVVAEALSILRSHGVDGPYAIALGPPAHTALSRSTLGGYPVLEHVRRLVDGPILWAAAVDGAVVVSTRGGDFSLTTGRDFSIGYLDHDATRIHLYVEESFTFRVLGPEAVVPLHPAA
jgi:uncharacterized linocin/CFP29 family protein